MLRRTDSQVSSRCYDKPVTCGDMLSVCMEHLSPIAHLHHVVDGASPDAEGLAVPQAYKLGLHRVRPQRGLLDVEPRLDPAHDARDALRQAAHAATHKCQVCAG